MKPKIKIEESYDGCNIYVNDKLYHWNHIEEKNINGRIL